MPSVDPSVVVGLVGVDDSAVELDDVGTDVPEEELLDESPGPSFVDEVVEAAVLA